MENEKAIIEMLARQVKIWISCCKEEADEYTKDMNEDYEHFFCWHSEDMFKVQKRLKIYRYLRNIICTGGLEEVLEYMRHTVEHFTDDLLLGSVQNHSTNNSFNTAHLLEMEVKQRILSEFKMMLLRAKKEQGEKIAG